MGNVLNKVESITDNSNATTNVQTNYSYDNSGRLLNEQVLVNSALQADLVYAYDQLGRLTAKTYKKGSWSTQETISYNLRGWLTNQSGSYFSMNLNYETTQSPNATKKYSGSISELAWQQGSGVPQNLYQFDYDGVERLKKATQFSKSGSAWSPTSAHFVENGITYDKNGNILTLKRTAGGSIVDNLAYTYTGNQLTGLTEQVSTSASNDIFVRGTNALGNYTYDTNGNMITDSRKNLQFEYNLLNLPTNVKSGEAIKARYVYTADGNKLQVRDGDGTNGYDYVGSFVYKKNNLGTKLEVINFSNGVITKVGDSYEVNYFMRDHLGSVRAIVDGTGTLKEQSDYYAFGARQKRSDYLVSENRYRYNGKEVQTTGDLGYLDYGARMYDAGIGRWFAMDPAQQHNSGYIFGGNNPINRIDIGGQWDIRVHLYNSRATYGYGIAVVTDRNGNEVYRMNVRAEGVGGRNRMIENSDTPLGTYDIPNNGAWISGGNRKSYGPNHRLVMIPSEGEIVESGRDLIRIHGGRQERYDSNTKKWIKNENPKLSKTQGCLRAYDDDMVSLKDITDLLQTNDKLEKPGSVFVQDDLEKITKIKPKSNKNYVEVKSEDVYVIRGEQLKEDWRKTITDFLNK